MTCPADLPAADILGVLVRRVSFEETISLCQQAIEEDDKLQITTCNLDFLQKARANRDYQELLNRTLNVADGVPLIWASKLLKQPLPGRVNGTDILERLCQMAADKGWRVYLLGAMPDVNQAARDRLTERYPGLQIYGHGPQIELTDDEANRAIATEVAKAKPDILFVALGAPRQDFWIDRYQALTGAKVAMGCGGALDIVSGLYKRAPLWMQRNGLEWLYRLTQQPGYLWKRYLSQAVFFFRVLLQSLSLRRRSRDTH